MAKGIEDIVGECEDLINTAIDDLKALKVEVEGDAIDIEISLDNAKDKLRQIEDLASTIERDRDEAQEEAKGLQQLLGQTPDIDEWMESSNMNDISLREFIGKLFDSGYTSLEIENHLRECQ